MSSNANATQKWVGDRYTPLSDFDKLRKDLPNIYQVRGDYLTNNTFKTFTKNIQDNYIQRVEANGKYQVIGDYALKSDIPQAANFATKGDLSAFQPAGDYALRADLSAFQPKGNYQPKGDYQPAGNYAMKSDLAGYQPVGNYQPAGDYAVKADLSAFQPKGDYQPKGNYQPAGDYALKSDIPQAANFAAKGDLSAYQLKGDYAVKGDLSAFQPKGDYAVKGDLSAFQPKGDYAVKGDLSEKLNTKTLRADNGISIGGVGEFSIDFPDVGGGRFLVDNQGNFRSRGDANIGGNINVQGNAKITGTLDASGRNILGEIDELKNRPSGSTKHICVNECGNIRSPNGRFYVGFNANGDGLLAVARADNGTEIWNNGSTPGTSGAPYKLYMQGDGNLVIYNKNGAPTWASNTDGKGRGPYKLYLDDNGKLSIIDGTELSIWGLY